MFAGIVSKLSKHDESLLSLAEPDGISTSPNIDNNQTYQSIHTNNSSKPTDSNHVPVVNKFNRTKSSIYDRVASFKFRRECPVLSIFALYSLLTFLSAFIGGIIFHVCEYETENTEILQKRELYQQISSALNDIDPSYQEKLDKLLHMCDIPLVLDDNRWTIPKSAFFAFTTASTIGYGYTTPTTFWGRASTFIFGLPAIMLFGLSMIQIGHAIVNKIDKGASHSYIGQLWISSGCFTCSCVKRCSIELQRTVCIFILLGILLCFSAWSMRKIEKEWTFNDGLYFMWISISTIGYGDYEPSVIQSSYWANGLVWLGLCLTAILIGSSQDYFQMKVKWWRKERIIMNKSDVMLQKLKKTPITQCDHQNKETKSPKNVLQDGDHEIQTP